MRLQNILVPALAIGVAARGVPTKTQRRSLATRQDAHGTVPDDTKQPCTYYVDVEYADEDCTYWESFWDVSHEEFVAMNPSVKDDCSGIKVGYSYCIEINYGVPTTTTGTGTGPTDTSAPVPSPVRDGTTKDCDKYYFVEDGQTCSDVLKNTGVSLADLYKWNTDIKEDCTGLWAKVYICVAGPGATMTTPGGSTPTDDPSVPSPTQEGAIADCEKWYFVEAGTTCSDVLKEFDLTIAQFYGWNEGVKDDCTGMWSKVYVCVAGPGATTTTPGGSTPTDDPSIPSPTQEGSIADCDKWYFVESGTTCSDILNEFDLTIAQFYGWNEGVKDDCTGMWSKVYVCVAGPGGSPTDPDPPTTTTDPSIPSPTQEGSIADCEQWYFVESGTTCSSILSKFHLTIAQFYQLNKGVKDDCTGMWAKVYVCVKGP